MTNIKDLIRDFAYDIRKNLDEEIAPEVAERPNDKEEIEADTVEVKLEELMEQIAAQFLEVKK